MKHPHIFGDSTVAEKGVNSVDENRQTHINLASKSRENIATQILRFSYLRSVGRRSQRQE